MKKEPFVKIRNMSNYYLMLISCFIMSISFEGKTENIILNPSFEKSMNSKATNWICSGNYAIDMKTTKKGNNSICLAGSEEKPTSWIYFSSAKSIPVTSGKQYLFSLWIKTEKISKLNHCAVRCRMYNKNKKSYSYIVIYPYSGTTSWNRYSSYLTIPENVEGVSFSISILNEKGAKVWFDNLSLMECVKQPKKINCENQTIHFSFNNTLVDDAFTVFPILSSDGLKFVDGKTGKGVLVSKGMLGYPVSELINTKSGTIEYWICPQWNPKDKGVKNLLYIDPWWLSASKRSGVGDIHSRIMRGTLLSSEISDWAFGTWHHLALTWDCGSNISSLYVDGKLKARGKCGDLFAPGKLLLLGCGYDGPGDVAIDELNISRYALSMAEIISSYRQPDMGGYE